MPTYLIKHSFSRAKIMTFATDWAAREYIINELDRAGFQFDHKIDIDEDFDADLVVYSQNAYPNIIRRRFGPTPKQVREIRKSILMRKF